MPRGDAQRGRNLLVLALAGLAALLFVLSLGIGPVRMSPLVVVQALVGGGSEEQRIIVQEIRLPRAILGLSIGAVLGLSGAALQGLLRNPLAAPSLFGAPQAAAFGGRRRDRARLGRRALLRAAGRRDRRRVRLGVPAARRSPDATPACCC